MKSYSEYRYFSLSFNYVISNLKVLIILKIIEYFIYFTEFLRQLTLLTENFDVNFNANYKLNKVNLIYQFRKLVINSEKNEYPIYLMYIILLIQTIYYIFYYASFSQRFERFNKIFVNIYDYFFFRMFYIFLIEPIHNFILIYWNKIALRTIHSVYIFLGIFAWLYIVMGLAQNLLKNVLMIKIRENNNYCYPFDYLTCQFFIFSFFFNTLLSLSEMVYISGGNINITKLIIVTLICMTFFQLFIEIYILFTIPYFYIYNWSLHKLRFCSNLFLCLCEFGLFLHTYRNKSLHYITMVVYFIISVIFFYILNIKNLLFKKIYKMDIITNLFYIKTIRTYNSTKEGKYYIKFINYHINLCSNCDFCKYYSEIVNNKSLLIKKIKRKSLQSNNVIKKVKKKADYSDDNVTIEEYILYIIFLSFLKVYKNNIKKDKSLNKADLNFDDYLYDLFSIFQFDFLHEGVNYELRYKISKLINKYTNKNLTIALNILLIYQQLYENKDETDVTVLENMNLYDYFLAKIQDLINSIISFYVNEKKSPNSFLKLGEKLGTININLKILKKKQNLNDYCFDILSYIVEEFICNPLNKERGYVKDNILFNDDMINLNFNNSKNIIMTLSPTKNSYILIKTGKDMHQYLGKDLTHLFPKEFKQEGKNMFYKSLYDKHRVKNFDFLIQLNNTNPLIEEENNNYTQNIEDKNVRKIERFNMKYTLLYNKLDDKEEIYLNGEYNLGIDELIITKQIKLNKNNFFINTEGNSKNEEFIFYISLKKVDNIFKKKSKNVKFSTIVENQDLITEGMVNINEFFTKINKQEIKLENLSFKLIYEIKTIALNFYVYSNDKKKIVKKNSQISKFNSVMDENESNFNIDTNSVNTFNSQSSLTNQNSLKQKSLKQKDYKLLFYEKRFNKLSKYIYLLFFITLIIYLISLLVELNKKNNLNQGYNIYIQYRYLNRLYYNIFTALFSMICLSDKNSPECTNYFIKYINNLLSNYNSDFKIFEFFYYENLIKINTFSSNLIHLKKLIYNLDDDELTNHINAEINYTMIISQGGKIRTNQITTSFINALEIFANSLIIITANEKFYEEPFYIVSIEENDFSNVYDQNVLSDTLTELYNVFCNYIMLVSYWIENQRIFSNNSKRKLSSISNCFLLFLTIALVFNVSIFILLLLYVNDFENIFKIILNKLVKKINDNEFTQFFIEKYENLKILIRFFEKNPLNLIKDIETSKNDFIKLITQKIEEEKKNESSSESTKLIYYEQREYIDIKSIRLISKKYFLIIFLILITYLFLFLFFLIFWIVYYNKIKNIFDIITNDTLSSCVGYNLLAIGQIMILGNISLVHFSSYIGYKGDYILEEYEGALSYLLSDEFKNIKNIKDLFKSQKKLINLNCSNFLDKIDDGRINTLISDHPEFKFHENYPHLCNFLSYFEYNDEKIIYKEVFFQLHHLYSLIYNNNRTYESLLELWGEKNILNISIYQHLYYRPYRTWKNYHILDNAINESLSIIDIFLIIHLIILIVCQIFIFLIIQFFLFRALNKSIKIINNCRNVFRIIK